MSTVANQINQTLMSAPLPLLIEKLGFAIANAQVALDRNSIDLANKMARLTIPIEGKEYNLISLGFTPTFYAFTEATIEAKLSFSLAVSESFSIGGSFSTGSNSSSNGSSNSNSSTTVGNTSMSSSTEEKINKTGIMAVSIDASYSRKFDMSAEGSSSIAARIVSLPPPDKLKALLQEISEKILVTDIAIQSANNVTTMNLASTLQFSATVSPTDATDQAIVWSIASGNGIISPTGLLSLKPTAIVGDKILVKVAARENPSIFNTKEITIN